MSAGRSSKLVIICNCLGVLSNSQVRKTRAWILINESTDAAEEQESPSPDIVCEVQIHAALISAPLVLYLLNKTYAVNIL